jgi:hypothetical protein
MPGRVLREIVIPPVNRTMSAPLRPSSRVIPARLEAIFARRDVYTLVIPGPKLPEYLGDWVVWFAERQPSELPSRRVAAPVLARKFTWSTPPPPPSVPPVTGSFQFAVVIDRVGRLSSVRLLQGPPGEAFRARATEELGTWEFKPALLNGEPMEVDAVLDFTLRLSPN